MSLPYFTSPLGMHIALPLPESLHQYSFRKLTARNKTKEEKNTLICGHDLFKSPMQVNLRT